MKKFLKTAAAVTFGSVCAVAGTVAAAKVIDKICPEEGYETGEDALAEAASNLGDAGEDAEPDPATFVPTKTIEDTDRVEA